MIIQAIGRALGILLLWLFIGASWFFILHQHEKANDRFELSMLKDINKVGRELKQTGLEDKTIQIVKSTLERVHWNIQRYVDDTFFWQFFSLIFLVPMFAAAWTTSTPQKMKLWK